MYCLNSNLKISLPSILLYKYTTKSFEEHLERVLKENINAQMFPHFSSKYCISRVKSDKVVVKKFSHKKLMITWTNRWRWIVPHCSGVMLKSAEPHNPERRRVGLCTLKCFWRDLFPFTWRSGRLSWWSRSVNWSTRFGRQTKADKHALPQVANNHKVLEH